MIDLVYLKASKELQETLSQLKVTPLFHNQSFCEVHAKTKKELLLKAKTAKAKKLITIFKPLSEDFLRFALERTPVDIIYGQESINPRDSVHFPRGGLDQVTCKIAKEKGKVVAFSLAEIHNARNPAKLLKRMRFNAKMLAKYKVTTLLITQSKQVADLRSQSDLKAFTRMIGLRFLCSKKEL